MKVIMLAAGAGSRLGELSKQVPKILLRFGGQSLLERHIEILKRNGITELVIGVGYKKEMVEKEISRLHAEEFVTTVHNENFREGTTVTLRTLRKEFLSDSSVILMDADVLYDELIFQTLINSSFEDCLLIDRDFTPGEDPEKVCLKNNRIVDFGKHVEAEYDTCGESVGFFKFSAPIAKKLIDVIDEYIEQGRSAERFEAALRDVLLAADDEAFACEDITGLPWIEIDFPEDIESAENDILPKILITENGPDSTIAKKLKTSVKVNK